MCNDDVNKWQKHIAENGCYLSEWQGTDNAWYNAIKEMDRTQFSNEENQYIDNFYSRCDGTPHTVESHSE